MLQLIGLFSFGIQKRHEENISLTFLKNYTHEEYLAQPQNWDILQDKNDIIYIANQGCLLAFDSVSWKEIDIPNITARSIAINDSGTIFVGGKSEIGFLSTGPKGALKYISLLNNLKTTQKNFGPVWRTFATKEGIYFWTSKFLFRWNPKTNQMMVWEAESVYNSAFSCKGYFYVRQKSIGLMKMINNTLQLFPGGEIFANENIYFIVPYDDKGLLLGTRSKGLFLFDEIQMKAFPTEADDYLKEKQLYIGTRLSSGDFSLATRLGGIVIIDSIGRLKQVFNKDSGLNDNNVRFIFEDSQGNLWLALNSGVAKIEYTSPFSIYDEQRSDLPGFVLSVIRHAPNQKIYAGTTNGLYYLAPNRKFLPVPGISSICWALLSLKNSLLVATRDGIFVIDKNNQRQIFKTSSFVLFQSKRDTNRVWVSTPWGLTSIYHREINNQWEKEYKFKSINEKLITITENQEGNLWLGTETGSAIYIEFPKNGSITDAKLTRYNSDHGLTTGDVHAFSIARDVVFTTKKGVCRFDKKKQAFEPYPIFGDRFANGSRSVFRIVEDKQKNIWFHSKRRNFLAAPQANGTYKINETPFLRLPLFQVNEIYPDPEKQFIWFAGHKGLLCYDKTKKKDYHFNFPAHIRTVKLNGEPIFNGYKLKRGTDSNDRLPVFDYRDISLRFEFAAPFYEGESATVYQCLLEGYSQHWTEWDKQTNKEFPKLDPGTYTFRVRAKNIYHQLSEEDSFQFKILPPWYQTWWAFSIYGLGFLFLMRLIVRWRSKHLEKEKKELEKIIKKRTAEIQQQKQKLEEQTLQLAKQSEKLKEMDKVKSRFFANISHEFRTPITLIMGPLEQMLSSCPEHDLKEKKKLKMMIRNCSRLLRLINQLLELSNFESGTMRLQSYPRNIIPFLKGIIASFEILSDQEEQDLIFNAQEENITLFLDDRKFETIICNLLINAIKFTPAGGKITISCSKESGMDANFPLGSVKISISDTGPGIPEEELTDIFDRFYQSKSTYEHSPKGFGIGLAITRELVELHHGTIQVNSKKGQGTAFIIHLPLGNQHLKPDEIVGITPSSETLHEIKEIPAPLLTQSDKEKIEPGDLFQQEPITKKSEKNIILVVEDNMDMRNYIKDALQPQYQVIEALNGRIGIKKAGQIIPDLIISDIMMPETDGYELCRVLKNNRDTSHIPIILLTAKASEGNMIEGLEIGADDYITKPFNTRLLCARIKNLIEIRKQLQQKMKQQETLRPIKVPVSDVDSEFLRDLQKIIDKNISDPEFGVDDLSSKLYMGRTTLYRKIRALSGETAKEFLRSYRLKRGAELLKKKSLSVLEVSLEVGFSSSSYFAKCFKEKFHQLPSQYQISVSQR